MSDKCVKSRRSARSRGGPMIQFFKRRRKLWLSWGGGKLSEIGALGAAMEWRLPARGDGSVYAQHHTRSLGRAFTVGMLASDRSGDDYLQPTTAEAGARKVRVPSI